MSEHTPKPWGFGNGREGERLILGRNGEGNYVGHVQIHQMPRHMGMMDEEERKANAQLILAAPDMLEVLKEYVDEWAKGGFFYGKDIRAPRSFTLARAAIAKAEGSND